MHVKAGIDTYSSSVDVSPYLFSLYFLQGVAEPGASIAAADAQHYKLSRGRTGPKGPWQGIESIQANDLKPFGLVTSGGMSFSRGAGVGIGLCAATALAHAMAVAQTCDKHRTTSALVLVKNCDSTMWRPANLTVHV